MEKDGFTRELFPNEARLRNLTYSSTLYVDVKKRTSKVNEFGMEIKSDEDELKEVPLCKIPVMVRSYVCWLSRYQTTKVRCFALTTPHPSRTLPQSASVSSMRVDTSLSTVPRRC